MIRERDRPAQSGSPLLLSFQKKISGFGFNCEDNVLGYSDKVVEYWNRRFATKEGGLVDNYLSGYAYLSTDVLDAAGRHVGQLFFAAVPLGLQMVYEEVPNEPITEADALVDNCHGRERPMYLLVSDLVESVEGAIPTLVWFEPFDQEGNQLGRNRWIFSPNVARSIFFGLSEWEFRIFRSGFARQNTDAVVDRMIKRGSECSDYVECNRSEIRRDFAVYSRLKEGLAGPAVFLSEFSVRFQRAETVFNGFKFADMAVRPFN